MLLKTLFFVLGVTLFSPAHCLPPNSATKEKLKQSVQTAIQILTPLAATLKKYRAETGKFPKEIAELAPENLDKIPSDLQFIYREVYDLQDNSDPYASTTVTSYLVMSFGKTLEQYKQDNLSYPESLNDLYPNYISAKPDEIIKEFNRAAGKDITLIYKTRHEFGFEISATPPGDDGCRYDFEASEWKCFGWANYR